MTLVAKKRVLGSARARTAADIAPRSWATSASPIGDILLVADEAGLREVHLPGSFAARDEMPATAPPCPPLIKATEQLEAYFAGELTRFDLPLAPIGSAFQLQVWYALADIPYASTESYGSVAARVGNPRASRGRHGQQQEPARDRAPVPSRDRCQRQPRRLRGRALDEGLALAARKQGGRRPRNGAGLTSGRHRPWRSDTWP